MYDVLVVGSANADLTVRVERRPGAGETVLGTDLVESAGGKGANQAAAAARLGGRTALLARVGGDAYGQLLLDAQRAAGTDVGPVIVDDAARTGTAMIIVSPDGDNSIVVSPGANAACTPQDVAAAKDVIEASSVLSLQLEIPMESVRAAAEAAEQAGTRVLPNLSPAPEALAPELLAVADPLVVNEHEAAQLSGRSGGTPGEWAAALRERGARSVVMTLGADGALVLDSAGVRGAGDQGQGGRYHGRGRRLHRRPRHPPGARRRTVRRGPFRGTRRRRRGHQAGCPALVRTDELPAV